jgi:hypothetical protein
MIFHPIQKCRLLLLLLLQWLWNHLEMLLLLQQLRGHKIRLQRVNK